MKIRKYAGKLVVTLLISALSLMPLASFAESSDNSMTLDQAVKIAIENSKDLRIAELNDRQINDAVRKGQQGSGMLELSLDSFYEFSHMYDDSKDFNHLKGLTSKELQEALGKIYKQMGQSTNATYIAKKLEEEKFIFYLFQFGNEAPVLDKEDKYYRFVKNIEMSKATAEKEKQKYDNNIKMIESNIKNGVTQLFLSIQDLEKSLLMQKEMLKLKEQSLSSLSAEYNVGQVSKNTFDTESQKVEVLKKQISNLEIQLENLKYNLNNQLGYDLEKDNYLISMTKREMPILVGKNEEYINKALTTNTAYQNAKLDYDNKLKEYNLFLEYVEDKNYDKYILESDLKQLKATMDKAEMEVVDNVYGAIDSLNSLEKKIELQDMSIDISRDKLLQARKSYELGLINKLTVDSAELSYLSELITKQSDERNLNKGIIKFEMLLNDGIKY